MDTISTTIEPCQKLFREIYRLKHRYSRFLSEYLFYRFHHEPDDSKGIQLRDKWLNKDNEIREVIDTIQVNYPDEYQSHISDINDIIHILDENKRIYAGGKIYE